MRYFFDIHDGRALTLDRVGIECATLEELRVTAIDGLPDLARDEMPNGDDTRMSVKVRDVDGNYLFEASLTLSVKWVLDM